MFPPGTTRIPTLPGLKAPNKHKGLRPVKQPPRSAARHLRHAGRHRLSIHASACLPMVCSPLIIIASDCRTDSQLAVSKRTQHTCVLRHSKSSGPATERMGRSEIVRWRLLQLQLDALDRSSEDLAVRGFCREQQPNPQGLDPRDPLSQPLGWRGSLSLAHASETAHREKLSTYWV